jgi:hypothetical protein
MKVLKTVSPQLVDAPRLINVFISNNFLSENYYCTLHLLTFCISKNCTDSGVADKEATIHCLLLAFCHPECYKQCVQANYLWHGLLHGRAEKKNVSYFKIVGVFEQGIGTCVQQIVVNLWSHKTNRPTSPSCTHRTPHQPNIMQWLLVD